jgi:catechol 2,3-dioxygenase-like lactoylglutathione lyase family enzyme
VIVPFPWSHGAVLKHFAEQPGIQISSNHPSASLEAVRPQPLICVTDVEASSRWYQRLLGCQGAHGGTHYEQLVKDGELILQLHNFEVEHHHGPIGDRADRPYGNGVLLWFEVEDFDAVMKRAAEMGVEIVLPRHRNPPDDDNGGPNHWECWMRDPDGYTVVVASPYGTADGTWRPGPDLFKANP